MKNTISIIMKSNVIQFVHIIIFQQQASFFVSPQEESKFINFIMRQIISTISVIFAQNDAMG